MKQVLIMYFLTDRDEKVSIRLDDPASDLSEGDVSGAMDKIILDDVFIFKNAKLAQKHSAQIVTTTANSLKIQ